VSGEASQRLIVAFLERGKAHHVAQALHASLGLEAVHYGHGRGAGMLHAVSAREMVEVDMLSVVVDADRCDQTFAFVYEAAEINRPGGGMVFQMPLVRVAALGLPLPEIGTGADLKG
jgi:nitrogen regulatory protein PII